MNRPLRFLKFVIIAVVGIAVLGGLIMSLWNWLLPALFAGVHTIDFIQALGLFLLCRILFGGLRHHGGWGARRQWHQQWQQRWEQMSEEERSKFRGAMRSYGRGWGGWAGWGRGDCADRNGRNDRSGSNERSGEVS